MPRGEANERRSGEAAHRQEERAGDGRCSQEGRTRLVLLRETSRRCSAHGLEFLVEGTASSSSQEPMSVSVRVDADVTMREIHALVTNGD